MSMHPASILTPYVSDLGSGPVRLMLESLVPAAPDGQLVPYLHFLICRPCGERVGHLNFRIGNTRHVLQVAGHVGYAILPQFRGRSLACHACLALAPLARNFYPRLMLTTDPGNPPSIRTIEKLGAKFLDEAEVPEDDPAYKGGARRKRRYCWNLAALA